MKPGDDFPGDMEEFPFDDHDSDAVFGAAAGAPDVPESLRDVADLVYAARRSGSADELAGADGMVAGIASAIGEHAARRRGAYERIPVLHKYRTAKVAATATFALVLGGGVAAAATGALPTPVQPHHQVELASHESDAPIVAAEDHSSQHDGVFGAVASVNGVTDPGTCGTAGAAGSFTITDRDGNTITVDVTPDTKFFGKDHDGPASFADVCVGQKAGARGAATDSNVAAAMVFAFADHQDADNHEGDDPEVEHHEADDNEVEEPEVEHHEADDHEVEQPEVEQPEVEQPEVEQPDTAHEVEQPDAAHEVEHDGGSDHSGSDHRDD